jgi:hypothetical protein
MSAQSRAQTIDRARLDQHRSAYELAERAAGACTAHWRMDVDRPWLEIDDGPDDDPELGELEQQDELAAGWSRAAQRHGPSCQKTATGLECRTPFATCAVEIVPGGDG